MRRKIGDENIRKLFRIGSKRSVALTLPIAIVRALRWQEGQKVVVNLKNKKITIEDWVE